MAVAEKKIDLRRRTNEKEERAKRIEKRRKE